MGEPRGPTPEEMLAAFRAELAELESSVRRGATEKLSRLWTAATQADSYLWMRVPRTCLMHAAGSVWKHPNTGVVLQALRDYIKSTEREAFKARFDEEFIWEIFEAVARFDVD